MTFKMANEILELTEKRRGELSSLVWRLFGRKEYLTGFIVRVPFNRGLDIIAPESERGYFIYRGSMFKFIFNPHDNHKMVDEILLKRVKEYENGGKMFMDFVNHARTANLGGFYWINAPVGERYNLGINP